MIALSCVTQMSMGFLLSLVPLKVLPHALAERFFLFLFFFIAVDSGLLLCDNVH